MKCAHCDYEYGWSGVEMRHIEGLLGEFYEHPVKLERDGEWRYSTETKTLLACPSCRKTFMAEGY